MTQKMVAQVWEHKREISLIHPQELDFNDPEVETMLDAANVSLSAARSRDIVKSGAGAAETLAKKVNEQTFLDAAKLVYLSSLSSSVNAIQGLSAEEIAAYLCAPGRDVSQISNTLLSTLEGDSWYLHRRTDNRWCYREIKNVNSVIKENASITNEDTRCKLVKELLEKQFKPGQIENGTKPVYQKLLVFPAVDDIKLELNEVTLIISEPRHDGLHPDLQKFWTEETLRNRVMFLTGTDGFGHAKENAAYMRAAEQLIADYRSKAQNESSAEFIQAKAALDQARSRLYSALRETFTSLHYPIDDTLHRESLKFMFTANNYVAEATILESLRGSKFRNDVNSDSFRGEFEQYIFNQPSMPWKDIQASMARDANWYWTAPGSVESLKQQCILKGIWRDEGLGQVRKGPFPKEKTSATPRTISSDNNTGKATVEVEAKHGDRVHFTFGDEPVTASSPLLEGGRLETDQVKVNFLTVDSSNKHETGLTSTWKNEIRLKYRFEVREGGQWLVLECAPTATIRFTLNGADPKHGGVYSSPVPIPADAVLILAIAERDGVWSNKLEQKPPTSTTAQAEWIIDPDKSATWRPHALKADGRKLSFQTLSLLKQHDARVRGFGWKFDNTKDADQWLHLHGGPRMLFAPDELEQLVLQTSSSIPSGDEPIDLDATFKVSLLEFKTGAQLMALAQALGVEVRKAEVVQQ